MKHYGDITKINGAEVEPVHIIVGGSPCQDLSVAGKRAGLDGARSGLFMEQIRIVKEMREHEKLEQLRSGRTDKFIRSRFLVWENVPGAFSSGTPKGADFQAVLTEIVRIVAPNAAEVPLPKDGKWNKSDCIVGYGEDGQPFSIAYRLHDAQFWGVTVTDPDGKVVKRGTPQRRKRIALVADFGGFSAPEILFESESVSGDITESREEGQGTSEAAERNLDATSYTLKIRGGAEYDRFGKRAGKGALIQEELSGTLGVSQDQTLICLEGNGTRDSHKGDGYKESETMFTLNTVEQHAVCMNAWDVQSKHIQPESGVAESLYAGECRGGGGESYVMQEQPILLESNQNHATVQTDGVSTALPASAGMGGGYVPMVAYGISSYDSNSMKSDNPHSGIYEAETSRTLDLNGGSPACNQGGMAIVQSTYQETTGALMASGYQKLGTQEATNDMYVVTPCSWDGKQTSSTLTAHNASGSQRMPDKENFNAVITNDPTENEDQPMVCLGLDRASFNQGQNAQYDFAVEEELAPTVLAKGPGGGTCETIGALCARDYKGVGSQYVEEGKCVVQFDNGNDTQS